MGTGGTSASSAPAIYAQHISLTYSLYFEGCTLKTEEQLAGKQSTVGLVVEPSTYEYTPAERLAALTLCAYQPCSLQGVLPV